MFSDWLPSQQIFLNTKEGPRRTFTIPLSKTYEEVETILISIFTNVFQFSIPTVIYGLKNQWYCGGFEKKLEYIFSEFEKKNGIPEGDHIIDRALAIMYSLEKMEKGELEITRIVGHEKNHYIVEVEGTSLHFQLKESRFHTESRKRLLREYKGGLYI